MARAFALAADAQPQTSTEHEVSIMAVPKRLYAPHWLEHDATYLHLLKVGSAQHSLRPSVSHLCSYKAFE